MQKINVGCIIKDHLRTFAGGGRIGGRALLWSGLPVLASAAAQAITRSLAGDGAKSIVYLSLAVALGATHGLSQLLRISAAPSLRGSHAQQRGELLRAAHANLSFALLFSVLTAAAGLIHLLFAPALSLSHLRVFCSFVVYLMAGALIQSLLAYLYRLHLLIAGELQLE